MFDKLNTPKGYIVALYDEYIKNINYDRKENKLNKILKLLYNKKFSAFIILSIICIITAIIKVISHQYFYAMGTLFICYCIAEFFLNINNSSLESYNNKIECLAYILKTNNLYDEKIIRRMLKETRGIAYKVAAVIPSILTAYKIFINNFEFEISLDNILPMIYLILCILAIVFSIFYLIYSFPWGMSYKLREMHKLLKLILVFDYQKDNNKDISKNIESDNILVE